MIFSRCRSGQWQGVGLKYVIIFKQKKGKVGKLLCFPFSLLVIIINYSRHQLSIFYFYLFGSSLVYIIFSFYPVDKNFLWQITVYNFLKIIFNFCKAFISFRIYQVLQCVYNLFRSDISHM